MREGRGGGRKRWWGSSERQVRTKGEGGSFLTVTTVTTPPPPLPLMASTTTAPLGSRKEHGAHRYSTCTGMTPYTQVPGCKLRGAQRHSAECGCCNFDVLIYILSNTP
jgi:hypothetical protein